MNDQIHDLRELNTEELSDVSGAIWGKIVEYVLVKLGEIFVDNSSGHQHKVGDGCSLDRPL